MGPAKEEQLKAWEGQVRRWGYEVDEKGYTCHRCGNKPTYSERETFFRTGYCLWCASTVDKKD
jgi:hypothetical protein